MADDEDEFEVDDEDQTMMIDEDDESEDFDDDEADEEDEDEEEGEDEEEDEEDAGPIKATGYKPDSNVYTIFLLLTFAAYGIATAAILAELQDYCDPNKFLWGMFADK